MVWVGGLYHPLGHRQQCCVFNKAQKQPQLTWWAETVIGSSLTPHATLLVPLSGPIDPVVDCCSFIGSAKGRL